jgi:hypothetical protein
MSGGAYNANQALRARHERDLARRQHLAAVRRLSVLRLAPLGMRRRPSLKLPIRMKK